ncbi:Oidioi.mRNA.OKI2018_I69.chr2.g8413.t1.cds [Oikopleura dioica]|uniref:Calcium load-activated calcium channel n=1 Tax=Oikopleura dioica TaxID=34765 RepID=A0ABN7TDQ2_OIKDI|nr:Oidioi.mRNA.OKI2018_I69.chr2.g8413.t1.cds [Oikopleura dioica]
MDKGSKKYQKEEAKVKDMSRELQSTKLGSMFAMMLVFGTIVSTVSSIYEGQSVAELPFEPIWFFKSFAQRGLINPKPTDCSFIFIYILSTMSVRQPIQKLLGFAPSRAASKLSNAGMQPASFTDAKNTYGSGAY